MSYEKLSREQLEEVVEELETQLNESQKEAAEMEQIAKKTKADFENYRKKESDRKERYQKQAQQKLAEQLITVMDNLERAIASTDQNTALVQGVKMVSDQLYEKLAERGLERINAEGEEFDPNYHKAVDTAEHDDHNRVVEQRRTGYRFDDKVLRPAEVVVGKSED